MREQIGLRAAVNGRSMNAEVVAMLQQVMDDPDKLRLAELEKELGRVEESFDRIAGELEGLDRRKFALKDEIAVRRAKLGKG